MRASCLLHYICLDDKYWPWARQKKRNKRRKKEKGGQKRKLLSIIIYACLRSAKSYRLQFHVFSYLIVFLSHVKLYIINKVKPSPKDQGQKIHDRRETIYRITFSQGKVHCVFYFYTSNPSTRAVSFRWHGSWFITRIFLQSTCRPRKQQLTRMYATRIELQCFSVTIATRCTPTHTPQFLSSRYFYARITDATIVRTIFINELVNSSG